MTRVSVLMGVYNEGARIRAAVESILHQTWQDWDLLIIDDGSTDGTFDIVQALSEADPRIRLRSNRQNLGLESCLNLALGQASGDLIARMDGDDVSLPDRFSRQVAFLSDHREVDVLGGGAIEVDDQGCVLGETCPREWHSDLIRHIYRENPFIHPTVMGRPGLWAALGGYDTTVGDAGDYELWLRGSRRFRYHNLQVPLIRYRRRPPRFRRAVNVFRVLWRSAQRDGTLLRHGWDAMRPPIGYVAWHLGYQHRSTG